MITYKLNPRQQSWVDGLRSGKYAQCTGSLESYEVPRENASFCCLGVGCRIAEKAGASPTLVDIDNNNVLTLKGGDLSYQPGIQKWLGLRGDCGQLSAYSTFERQPTSKAEEEFFTDKPTLAISSLVVLNDEVRATFPQIADFIETNAERLFELDSLIIIETTNADT
jgi:hypothetical protein